METAPSPGPRQWETASVVRQKPRPWLDGRTHQTCSDGGRRTWLRSRGSREEHVPCPADLPAHLGDVRGGK